MEMRYRSIGVIHSPFREPRGMPIQPVAAEGVRGSVEIAEAFAEGLKDLDGFSHIILIYHFHRCGPPRLLVTPFMDDVERGVLATRAPVRPNPIGLSIVRLLGVDLERGVLEIEDVDILDGTPLLDLKPYVSRFDRPPADRFGWLERGARKVRERRADERFVDPEGG